MKLTYEEAVVTVLGLVIAVSFVAAAYELRDLPIQSAFCFIVAVLFGTVAVSGAFLLIKGRRSP